MLCASPYGDGRASRRIVEAVATVVGAGSAQRSIDGMTENLTVAPSTLGDDHTAALRSSAAGAADHDDRDRRDVRLSGRGGSTYLFEPTPMAWAIAVRATPSASISPNVEVVYGTALDSRHRPVGGVRISVDRTRGRVLIALASVTSRPDGTFRIVSRLRAGAYTFVVTGKSGNKTIRSTHSVRLAVGMRSA